ncbi:hypothetical protein AAVH_37891 [Aphelenchoides avenae]|nr:hypothetical protein AAVH_37891 [Aphelenchus avenae]
MAGFIVFSSFPLINATLTIVFVKPYRDFTVHLLRRRARKSVEGRNDVALTPDLRSRVARVPSVSTISMRHTPVTGNTAV